MKAICKIVLIGGAGSPNFKKRYRTMKFTKIIATALLALVSLSANAFVKDYASQDIYTEEQLSKIKLDDTVTTQEKYVYGLSEVKVGFKNNDKALSEKGVSLLTELANTKEHGPSMLAIALYKRAQNLRDCGKDRRCKMIPNQEIIDWYERAEKLDNTGEVAFEIAGYWRSLGRKVGSEKAREWAKVGRKKSDAHYARLRQK